MHTEYRRIMNQIIYVVLCFAMVLATLILVVFMQQQSINETKVNRQVGKINQYYTRVVACLASVSPVQRTPEYVDSCYDKAEAATGVKAERYGDATK